MDLDKSWIIDQAGYMQETENPMLIDFLISLLKVLGEPQRMKILRILASNRDQKLCVTDIARILHLTQPAVTKHITIMKKTGFITSVREGKRVYYQVDLPMLEYYKKVFEATYPKGFYPCPYNLQCDQCPERETCA